MAMNEIDLLQSLRHFHGTEVWYRHEVFRMFTYTEGVQFLAENAECYWLLDEIFGSQYESAEVKREPFQCWTLTTDKNRGILTCEDGNGLAVFRKFIPFTDFPMQEIRLFFTDSVLLLPSEY